MSDLIDAARPAWAAALTVAFSLWGSPVTWLEIAAFVLSVAMVVCNMRVNPIGWPLAMASSLLYAMLFASSKLYGEATLQLFFIGMAVWGWWQWLRGAADGSAPLPVRSLRWPQRALATVATLAAWPAVALLLTHATDSDVPWADALSTTGSVTGTLMLGRKLVDNWAVWVAVNVFSVGLFAYKGLWLTVALYAVFAVMSVLGWRAWKRQQAAPAT